jgi:hypothetical protein
LCITKLPNEVQQRSYDYGQSKVILFCHKNPDFISEKLGTVLKQCSNWLVANKLSLHLGEKLNVFYLDQEGSLQVLKTFTLSVMDIQYNLQRKLST